jgi:hypothetical protein
MSSFSVDFPVVRDPSVLWAVALPILIVMWLGFLILWQKEQDLEERVHTVDTAPRKRRPRVAP